MYGGTGDRAVKIFFFLEQNKSLKFKSFFWSSILLQWHLTMNL
jgi:hypothetical protein